MPAKKAKKGLALYSSSDNQVWWSWWWIDEIFGESADQFFNPNMKGLKS